MKNIMVTGGAGFIGSNFIIYMLGRYGDIKIVNIDKLYDVSEHTIALFKRLLDIRNGSYLVQAFF